MTPDLTIAARVLATVIQRSGVLVHVDTSTLQSLLNDTSDIFEQIDALGRLPEGWRYGEGVPITEDVLERSKAIASMGRSLDLSVFAIPDVDGGIVLRFHNPPHTLEVCVNEGGSYDAMRFKTTGFVVDIEYEKEGLDKKQIITLLRSMAVELWTTFDSSIPSSLTPASGSTITGRSGYRLTGGSPSLNPRVQ